MTGSVSKEDGGDALVAARVKQLLSTLERDGVALASDLMSPEDATALTERCQALLEREALPFDEYVKKNRGATDYNLVNYKSKDWTIVTDFLGSDPVVDASMERLVQNDVVRGVLQSVMGEGYKLRQVNIRRHDAGSKGQSLHQDGRGGLGMSIITSDTPGPEGATVFLPGSHRWPIQYSDFGVDLKTRPLRRWLTSASGKAGTVAFWYRRTWHGRFPGADPRTAMFWSFWGQGATYQRHDPPESILDAVGPELRRLMDTGAGVKRLENGKAQVLDAPEKPDPELARLLFGKNEATTLSPWRLVSGMAQVRRRAIAGVRSVRNR